MNGTEVERTAHFQSSLPQSAVPNVMKLGLIGLAEWFGDRERRVAVVKLNAQFEPFALPQTM